MPCELHKISIIFEHFFCEVNTVIINASCICSIVGNGKKNGQGDGALYLQRSSLLTVTSVGYALFQSFLVA